MYVNLLLSFPLLIIIQGAWRIQKRAGLDYFLATIVRNYEIVLYTKEFPGVLISDFLLSYA